MGTISPSGLEGQKMTSSGTSAHPDSPLESTVTVTEVDRHGGLTVLGADPDPLREYLHRLWRLRGLMLVFAIREIRVRYSNTSFGLLWVLLQPIPSVIVFTFFFDRVIQVDTGDVPYSVFALIGLVGWNYFTYLSLSMGNAFLESPDVVKKIDFPRVLLPLSRVFSGGVDFIFALLLIALAMLIFQAWPDSSIVFFPFFVLLNIASGAALGIWFCILTFKRKDLMHVFPVLVNFGVWLSPVFFPTTILPSEIEGLMYINPMTVVCEGYRFALVGGEAPGLSHFISVPVVVLLLVSGIVYFRRIDRRIPEHL